MGKGTESLKGHLMKEAEKVIDELLVWTEETEKPSLSQIEEKVLRLRQGLSEEMAAGVIAIQAGVQPVPGPVCRGCGREMRYKGQKSNTVTSWLGEVKLERGYYYCNPCRRGLFPPG